MIPTGGLGGSLGAKIEATSHRKANKGLVVGAHGGGSGSKPPRKRYPPLTQEQKEFVNRVEEDPKGYFSSTTPDRFKADIEKTGLKTEPLGQGHFKGVPYEEGGGFCVHYSGDGYMQYHPAEHSHHGGQAYYKTSSANYHKRRFYLNGDRADEKDR